MLLSIIVPVYNCQNYLDRFFKSILDLIVQDFELILVDDGSTDESLKTLQSFSRSQKFECIVIHKENGGQSTARNLGLKQAKGDFVCFIDSDDSISKDYFSIFEKFNSSFQDYDMLIGNFETVSQMNTPSNKVSHNNTFKNISNIKDKRLFMTQFLKKHIKIHNSAICYKKDFLIDNNIFFPEDIRIGEDSIFIWKSLLSANQILYTKKIVYYYFNNPKSVMKSSSLARSENFLIKMKESFSDQFSDSKNKVGSKIYYNYIISSIHSVAKNYNFDDYFEFLNNINFTNVSLNNFSGIRFKLSYMLIKYNNKLAYRIISKL